MGLSCRKVHKCMLCMEKDVLRAGQRKDLRHRARGKSGEFSGAEMCFKQLKQHIGRAKDLKHTVRPNLRLTGKRWFGIFFRVRRGF